MEKLKTVELKNLSVQYDQTTALHNVSFSIHQGEFMAILGPNGAGKSTLIKTILGLLTPSSGDVFVLGKNPTRLSFTERSLIGYVPQYQKIDPRFPITVKEVVLMGRYARLGLFKRPEKQDLDAAARAMEFMGIQNLAGRSMGELSGGEKQRTLIARALTNDLKLLILDEPTTSLDIPSTEGLYGLLKKFKEERGLSIVVVSHDVGVVTNMVDTIACLAGRMVAHGRPAEALTEATMECMYGKDTSVFGHSHVPHVMVPKHKKSNGHEGEAS